MVTGGVPVLRYDLAWHCSVTSVVSNTVFLTDAIGHQPGVFIGYSAYVLRDAGGLGAAPQAEAQIVTGYNYLTGQITITAAYTAALAVGDEILMLHPAVSRTISMAAAGSPPDDFWSNPQEEVVVDNAATDRALPDIVVAGIPAAATVSKAVVFFAFRAVEDTSGGVNMLDGNQYLQVRLSGGTWTNALLFVDDTFALAANGREGADVVFGNINLSAIVTGNGTYNVRWHDSLADAANIQFNDLQVGMRIRYSV